MKYTITAVIPVVQYGNIQPSIEVEADSLEEGQALVMPHIQALWDKYGEKPLVSKDGVRQLVKAFVGGELYFDPINHTYTNKEGEVYLSGSQYAKSLEKPFDLERISGAMGDKFKVDPKDIQSMWKLKGDISAGLGTAIHGALELYGRYGGLAESIEKTTHLHDHPIVERAVTSFYNAHKGEKAVNEIFIVDHKAKRAGQIDRLLITGDKKCRVQDFKTNANIQKSIKTYWVQLKFYADIMKAAGWEVEGLDIFHWDGDWTTYEERA